MKSSVPEERDTKKLDNNVLRRLPKGIRGHVVAIIGELLGTFSFIFFAFGGTQVCCPSSLPAVLSTSLIALAGRRHRHKCRQ